MNRYSILLFSLAFMLSTIAHSQYALLTGQMQVNAGVGLSTWGLPLYVGADYGFDENISAGGELSFRSFSDRIYGITYRHSIIGVSGNANYHFGTLAGLSDLIDLYAGLNLGFYIWSSAAGYSGSGASGFGVGAQIGGRYYFKPNMAVNVELGGGNAFSGGKVGLSFLLD
ncbi:MAG: outer membrane beta-barrel protein [Flavobacteriales bacterium]